MVLEGGSLEVDGEGTLLATRSSLIDERRNPGVEEAVLSRRLGELLGVRAIIWLDGALEGDDTDGHIDNLARFVAPGRVVCGAEESPSDANHAALARAGAKLRRAVDAAGRRLEVIDLPMPPAVANRDGRLPASHLNFYIANRAVLVPTFGGESDDRALATLRELFPERAVVGVPSRTLVAGLGTLHCLSQQQPAV
jgi:agmatine deiminase